jgi:hypothetical protein
MLSMPLGTEGCFIKYLLYADKCQHKCHKYTKIYRFIQISLCISPCLHRVNSFKINLDGTSGFQDLKSERVSLLYGKAIRKG